MRLEENELANIDLYSFQEYEAMNCGFCGFSSVFAALLFDLLPLREVEDLSFTRAVERGRFKGKYFQRLIESWCVTVSWTFWC